jgi:hypothetical protein
VPRPLSPEHTARELESRSLTNAELHAFLDKNLGHEVQAWPMKEWDLDALTIGSRARAMAGGSRR